MFLYLGTSTNGGQPNGCLEIPVPFCRPYADVSLDDGSLFGRLQRDYVRVFLKIIGALCGWGRRLGRANPGHKFSSLL